jgi:beta-lactamase class A
VAELCEAAITVSDNTAANLLLDSFGGPPALTSYIRSLGDSVTRLDRVEPALNESLPDDPRDTTSPRAMVGLLRKVVLDDALAPGSRTQLIAWLQATTTGARRLRAGVPADWKVGDKTGTGERGSTCDVAVVWPPGRAPLLVAAYLTGTTASPATRDGTLAQVGQLAAAAAH